MRTRTLLIVIAVAAAPASAFAHGGGFATPPGGGGGGPQAAPGFGDPPAPPPGRAPETRWESWWIENREDLLKIAEHVDAPKAVAVTPGAGEKSDANDPCAKRAALAAQVKDSMFRPLLDALQDPNDFDVRCSAAIALGKIGDPRAAEAIENASRRDARPEVRRSALLALGLLGRAAELPFLCDVVKDRTRDADERSMAALGVGLLGGDDAATFLAYFAERAESRPDAGKANEAQLLGTVYAALGLTNSIDALRTLWHAADDENLDPFLRGHAILGLARLHDRESVDRFTKLLASSADSQLRRCAAVALGHVVRPTDAAAVKALCTCVEGDRDATTRRFAVAALGRASSPTTRSLLRARFQALSDPDKPFLALALAMQGDVVSAAAIRDALKTEHDDSVRAAYCTALGMLGDRDSVQALETQLGPGPTPGTYRGYAALALAVMPEPAARDIIWKRLPTETDPRVRSDYAVALGLLGDGRIRDWLLAAMKGIDGNYVKCSAAACLGVLRRSDVVPELVQMMENARVDGVVRALCAVALGQIGDPSLVPKLSRLASCGDATFATKALAEAATIL